MILGTGGWESTGRILGKRGGNTGGWGSTGANPGHWGRGKHWGGGGGSTGEVAQRGGRKALGRGSKSWALGTRPGHLIIAVMSCCGSLEVWNL